MPSLDAKVEALAIAYVELLNFLKEHRVIANHSQLTSAVEKAADRSSISQETKEALEELACMMSPTKMGMCEHQAGCSLNRCCTPPLGTLDSMIDPSDHGDKDSGIQNGKDSLNYGS